MVIQGFLTAQAGHGAQGASFSVVTALATSFLQDFILREEAGPHFPGSQ